LDLNQERRAWKSKNAFISKSVEHTFYSESGKSVDLEYYKYHRYEYAQNLDSIKMILEKLFSKSHYLQRTHMKMSTTTTMKTLLQVYLYCITISIAEKDLPNHNGTKS